MITPKATVKFSNFASLIPGGKWGTDEKFIGTLVFPEGTDLSGVEAAALAAWEQKFPGEPIGTDPFSEFNGQMQLKVKTKRKPGVVNKSKKPVDGFASNEDFDGCVVKAAITASAWEFAGNRGVSFSISALQVFEGESLETDPCDAFSIED